MHVTHAAFSCLCRVLASAGFFMYTGMMYDIAAMDSEAAAAVAITQADLLHPVFTFDMMELFLLADYLQITELVDTLRENFITPKSLFSSITFNLRDSEEMVASMLARYARVCLCVFVCACIHFSMLE